MACPAVLDASWEPPRVWILFTVVPFDQITMWRNRTGRMNSSVFLQNCKWSPVISVVGNQSLSVLWKLSKKGLHVICIPKSAENDFSATQLSFGFNSGLSFTASLLDTAFQAARSSSKIGVVEVLGQHAGWLALQAAMAVCADAVLIPEIRYDIKKVADQIKNKKQQYRHYGLVVVAEGAKSISDNGSHKMSARADSRKSSLSPLATGAEGSHVIDSSGCISLQVAKDLQRLTDTETSVLVLSKLSLGGTPTVVDRQLGLGYGACAIRALEMEQKNVLVVFQPPELKFIPLAEAINQFRTVPENSEYIRITRSLGISLGD